MDPGKNGTRIHLKNHQETKKKGKAEGHKKGIIFYAQKRADSWVLRFAKPRLM